MRTVVMLSSGGFDVVDGRVMKRWREGRGWASVEGETTGLMAMAALMELPCRGTALGPSRRNL